MRKGDSCWGTAFSRKSENRLAKGAAIEVTILGKKEVSDNITVPTDKRQTRGFSEIGGQW